MLNCNVEGNRLALEGDLQVVFLERLHQALAQAFGQSEPVQIDLSGITSVDTAGLQLLLAFARSRPEAESTRFADPPEFFQKALKLAGMDGHFAPYLD